MLAVIFNQMRRELGRKIENLKKIFIRFATKTYSGGGGEKRQSFRHKRASSP
jgi:hypothetical protein